MATARVEKVLIATHRDERDELLRRLQEEGILHISEFKSDDEKKAQPSLPLVADAELKQTLARLNQAISFLSAYAEKSKGGLFAPKPSLPASEFRRRVAELDLDNRLEETRKLSERAASLDTEERRLQGELELLAPWISLKHPPVEYISLKHTDARFVFISSREEKQALAGALKSLTANIQTVNQEAETEYAVALFPKDETQAAEDALKATGVKMIQLAGFNAIPKKEIQTRKKRVERIAVERKEVFRKAKQMSAEIKGLETALDHYENEQTLKEQYPKLMASERAAFLEGWVRSDDRKRLKEIVGAFPASEVVSTKPRKKEKPPVALQNSPMVKPFEMIMNLYGTPDGREADPTPFMAPFFALFFAMCLTDAGYGLIITAVTAYLIWGKKIRNDLVWILFYGGVLTIFTGAATGSWFGNIHEKLAISWFVELRNVLTWFDPLKDPMPFFYISLGAGFFQMMFGMGIAVVDGLRTKRYGHAFFEVLPWFLIYLGIPLMIAAAMGVLPAWSGLPILIVIIASLGVSLVLSNRPSSTSPTSAILLWAAMTAALLAAAKGAGLIPLPGILLKGILLGTVAALWLYTVFKGLSEKTLKVGGIVFGILGVAATVLYVTGIAGSNLFLVVVFIFNLVFSLSVLKGWGGRIMWGAYSVYSNTTGVLGIILSYVRLMALGMVTAGIAMAFNEIAWMLDGIPVLSVILITIVLIVGHAYNLAMSALGGFVHTLRLQYVEFLPQFFTGGGTPFEPFKLKTRYVKVTRRT